MIDDYIIATEKTISLKKIIKLCCKKYDLNWKKYTIISKKNIENLKLKKITRIFQKLKKILIGIQKIII
jgi:hypothetical protein